MKPITNILFLVLAIIVAGAAFYYLNIVKAPVVQAPGQIVPATTTTENDGQTSNGGCACPVGYRQEGEACNPECYYSTPKCLQPSLACKPAGENDGNATSTGTGMANPASVYCVERGGESKISIEEGGEGGVCVMPDGTECDEWDFFRTKQCGTANNNVTVCGRENCHGLDIKCGANIPDVCTMEYQLGDKCLRLVNCGVVAGVCKQIPSAAFDTCKTCVQKCSADFADDQIKMFDCESKCE